MRPFLERQRREKINKCLDELKDLMVSEYQAEGRNIRKMVKADILELAVHHIHKLHCQQHLFANPVTDASQFHAGFIHCATEVSRCLSATSGVDIELVRKLMTHLALHLNYIDKTSPLSVQVGLPTHPTTSYNTPLGSLVPPLSSSSEGSVNATPVSLITTTSYYAMPLTPASCTSSPGCGGGLLKLADVNVSNESAEPILRPC